MLTREHVGHVDDEFWKAFGPGLLDYARANGKPEFFMFGEVALDSSDAEAFTDESQYEPNRFFFAACGGFSLLFVFVF